jgi:hypothetical protein
VSYQGELTRQLAARDKVGTVALACLDTRDGTLRRYVNGPGNKARRTCLGVQFNDWPAVLAGKSYIAPETIEAFRREGQSAFDNNVAPPNEVSA